MTHDELIRHLERGRATLASAIEARQPDTYAACDRALREAIQRVRQPIQLSWLTPNLLEADGMPVRCKGLGVRLAFMCLALEAVGQRFDVRWTYSGQRAPAKCAQQALRRAADDVEPDHPRLASVLRQIGTERNLLVYRGRRGQVQCFSAWMQAFAQSDAARRIA